MRAYVRTLQGGAVAIQGHRGGEEDAGVRQREEGLRARRSRQPQIPASPPSPGQPRSRKSHIIDEFKLAKQKKTDMDRGFNFSRLCYQCRAGLTAVDRQLSKSMQVRSSSSAASGKRDESSLA